MIYHTTKSALEDLNKSFTNIESQITSNNSNANIDLKSSLDSMLTASTYLSNLELLNSSLKNNVDYARFYLSDLSQYMDDGFVLPDEDLKTLESLVNLNREFFSKNILQEDGSINYNYYNSLILGSDASFSDNNFDSSDLHISSKLKDYLNNISSICLERRPELESRIYN